MSLNGRLCSLQLRLRPRLGQPRRPIHHVSTGQTRALNEFIHRGQLAFSLPGLPSQRLDSMTRRLTSSLLSS